jgi:hypothetical protein
MTVANASLPSTKPGDARTPLYRPGVCNIGPEEIARRRRVGHVGRAASVILLAVLILAGLPAWTRLLVALPAILSASGYLQARLRFCAGFGWRGVFNFGSVGHLDDVDDPEARARDLARSRQIGFASLVIGVAVGVAAALLPL